MAHRWTQDEGRAIVRAALMRAFAQSKGWSAVDADYRAQIVRKIERSCYNDAVVSLEREIAEPKWGAKKFMERYSTRYSRIISNIEIDVGVGYNTLVPRIVGGHIDLDRISEMTNEQLCPQAGERERAFAKLRMEQKIELTITRLKRCGKCGENEVAYREYQGARADEGGTFSYTCVKCHHNWRER